MGDRMISCALNDNYLVSPSQNDLELYTMAINFQQLKPLSFMELYQRSRRELYCQTGRGFFLCYELFYSVWQKQPSGRFVKRVIVGNEC